MIDNHFTYRMSPAFKWGALHVAAKDVETTHLSIYLGENIPCEPIIFLHNSGTRPMDLIGTTWVDMLIISDRFLNILKSHGFTGWSSFPVEVYGKKKELIPGYHGLAITGRSGPFDDSIAVRTIRPPRCSGGSSYLVDVGTQIDPATWDGSDLFVPEGTCALVVVEAVRNAIVSAKLTNVRFTRLSEMESPVLNVPKSKTE